MKKLLFFTVILLIYPYIMCSQSCLPDGIIFNTQAQIDNFHLNYPGCTEIEGDVIISDELNGDITNLNGLSVLTLFGGDLEIINNPALTSLIGLENLTSIEGGLSIYSNNTLTSLTGLEGLTSIEGGLNIVISPTLTNLIGLVSLTSIGGDLSISNNPALTSLTGLENLTNIGGSLSVGNSGNLINLVGLESLTTIGGGLLISGNSLLTNLIGLESLTSISDRVYIDNNNNLMSLTGLENLAIIGGYLIIEYNEALINLTGLNNVTFIGSFIKIDYNNALTNLIGLESLISLGAASLYIENNDSIISLIGIDNIEGESIGNLSIINNDNLSTCEVKSVCHYLASSNSTIEIYGNATGCNSQEEVELACGTAFPLNLSVYSQDDSLCINDSVYLFSIVSGGTGNYSFSWTSKPPGFFSTLQNPVSSQMQSTLYKLSVTSSYQTIEDSVWVVTYPSPITFSLSSGGIICEGSPGIELYLDGSEINTEYELFRNSISTEIILSGTGFPISLGKQNQAGSYSVIASNNITSCKVEMENIAVIDHYYYSPPDQICMVNVDSLAGKNIISWNKTMDEAITSYNIYRESTSGGSFELIGNVDHDNLSIFTDNASNPLQRSFSYGLTTLDTCSNETSMSSVHTTMHLNINAGINSYNLIWTHYVGFDYQTYFIYRRQVPGGFQIIDSVPNTVTTYTDLNPPEVILDYLVEIRKEGGCIASRENKSYISVYSNIISTNVGIEDQESLSRFISIFPNPFSGSTSISYYLDDLSKVSIKIYNYCGQLINELINERQPKGNHQITWNVERLPVGIYFYYLTAGNHSTTGKIVVVR